MKNFETYALNTKQLNQLRGGEVTFDDNEEIYTDDETTSITQTLVPNKGFVIKSTSEGL